MKTTSDKRSVLLGLIVLFVTTVVCSAWLRLRNTPSDAEVVARSETIVVGRIRPDSIESIPWIVQHPRQEFSFTTRVHRVSLLVEETLKGTTAAPSIVVGIVGELRPGIEIVTSNGNMWVDVQGHRSTNEPSDCVAIYAIDEFSEQITGDIRSNHVWFLRHFQRSGWDTNLLVVCDRNDIKRISTRKVVRQIIRETAMESPNQGIQPTK